MEDYYIIYGWYYDNEGQQYNPCPWAVTTNRSAAIRFMERNTDESIELIIVKKKLDTTKLIDFTDITEKLTDIVNGFGLYSDTGWDNDTWEKYTTTWVNKDPEIYELNC